MEGGECTVPNWVAGQSAPHGLRLQQCTFTVQSGTGSPPLRRRNLTSPVLPYCVIRGRDFVSVFCTHSHSTCSFVVTSTPYHGTHRVRHVRPQVPSGGGLGAIARAGARRPSSLLLRETESRTKKQETREGAGRLGGQGGAGGRKRNG